MGMTKRDPKAAVSTSFDRRSSVACKYRRMAVMLLRAKAARRGGVAQHKPADSMNIATLRTKLPFAAEAR